MITTENTTPDEALVELALHDDHLIRAYAAGHPNTSVSTLRTLASDENDQVRYMLARNRNTPLDCLEAMDTASSRMWDLIDGGQWNRLHKEILADEFLALRVARELRRWNDSFDDFGLEVAEWVREANHPGESMEIMDAMWASEISTIYGVTKEKALSMITDHRAKN